MNELEHGELIDVGLYIEANNEVETRVPAIYNFELAVLNEGTLVFRPRQALADELALKCDALLHRKTIIVLGQACLALLVHHQHELYHFVF